RRVLGIPRRLVRAPRPPCGGRVAGHAGGFRRWCRAMSLHRYQRPALMGDFARAGIGLVISLGALAIAGFGGFTAWLFGVCAVVFLLFGLRTLLRSVTNYELTDMGLTRFYATGFGRSERALAWQGLNKLRLRFFPA